MPKHILHGVAGLTIEASMDGEVGGYTPAPPSGTDGSATISVNRTKGVAPAGFFFSVTTEGFTSSDPNFDPYSDLHYTWRFSDPGYYTRHDTDDMPWDRVYDDGGTIKICRGPDVYAANGTTRLAETATLGANGFQPASGTATFLGNDKNIAYGPYVCHVFAPAAADFGGAASKTFAVTCEVRSEPTEQPVAVAEIDIIMDNPDGIFTGSSTVLISPTGDVANAGDPAWAGSPVVGAQRFNTFADAVAATKFAGFTNLRYLFRRGETHDGTGYDWGNAGGAFENMQLGAYGTGTPPKFNGQIPDVRTGSGPDNGWAVWGVDGDGGYDSTNYLSSPFPSGNGIILNYGKFITVWDCSLVGYDIGIGTKSQGRANAIIGNTFVSSYFDYGIFIHVDGKDNGFCGVWSKQKIGTIDSDGGKKSPTSQPLYQLHSPFRVSGTLGPMAINMMDERSIGGWGGALFQPCHRMGFNPNLEGYIEEAVVDRLRAEGGQVLTNGLGWGSETAKKSYFAPALARKYIYDKVYIALPQHSDSPGVLNVTGLTIRNCITSYADTAPIRLSGLGGFLNSYKSDNHTYSENFDDFPIQVYNNTFVDRRSTGVRDGNANYVPPGMLNSHGVFVLDNNIFATPNGFGITTNDPAYLGSNYFYVPGEAIAADWLDGTTLWTATIDGYYFETTPNQTQFAIPADTAAVYAPTPAAPFAAGSGKVAIDDFFGRIRTGTPSKGAVEPI